MESGKRSHRDFVHQNTKISSPTLLAEVKLHLAHESLPIWQKTIDELEECGLEPPYWAFAWAGGQALARYLLDNPELARNRQVVDIGSGSGIVAIAAAMCGARGVLAIDIDPLAIEAIGLNAAANSVVVQSRREDILDSHSIPGTQLLCLGDLFYEAPMARRVMAFAKRCKGMGMAVLAGDPQRSYFPREDFRELAAFDVPVSKDLEDADVKKTRVWQLV